MTRVVRQADLTGEQFQEILKAVAGGEDYRVILPGAGVVRILPEPQHLSPEEFAKLLAHPGVARRLDEAADEVRRGDVIPDEEMDEVFRG